MYRSNVSTPEGYTPLSLAVSAGHVEVCRLLLRQGAKADAPDRTGVTALMHACMHGYSEIAELLLLHGALPTSQNEAGQTAASLAARYGRPSGLGVLFRHDATLVNACDGVGRTPLHWAVVSSHTPTVKYVLGRWEAELEPVDAEGCTPLHLLTAGNEILLLLFHGTPTRPSLTKTNKAGHTPSEAAAAAGAAHCAEMMRSPEGADADEGSTWLTSWGSGHYERNLLSFMHRSPLRSPPARSVGPSWMVHATTSDVLFALVPVVPPKLLALGASAIMAFSGGMGLVFASFIAENLLGHRASPHRLTGVVGANAALLFGLVASASFIFGTSLLMHADEHNAASTYLTLAALAGYWLSYARVQTSDPGFVPGADEEHAERYWVALERLPAGQGSPEGVCDRSEMFIPPRAAYSKLAGGLVRAMDHDCPWVGRPIGKGNHAAFFSMLLFGEIAMLAWQSSLYYGTPPAPYATWTDAAYTGEGEAAARARVALSGVPLMIFLHLMLTPLVFVHFYLATFNVTTKEHFNYQKHAKFTRGLPTMPIPGSRHWHKYSPYDRGPWRNLVGFWRGTRDDGLVGGGSVGAAAGSRTGSPQRGEQTELLEIRVDDQAAGGGGGARGAVYL